MNKKVREVVTANGGTIVGEEYFPLDHADYGETIEKIMSSGAEVVFNMTVPPGVAPFLEQLHDAGFTQRGGQIVCTYFDENLAQPAARRPCRGPLRLPRLLPGRRRSASARTCSRSTTRAYPGARTVHRRQRLLRPLPRHEALGGRRERGRLAARRTRSSRRSITPGSPRARAAPPKWCRASIMFA